MEERREERRTSCWRTMYSLNIFSSILKLRSDLERSSLMSMPNTRDRFALGGDRIAHVTAFSSVCIRSSCENFSSVPVCDRSK